MAVYGNLDSVNNGNHGIAESSKIKATLTGRLHDVLVCSVSGSGASTVYTPIDVDNGTMVVVGDYTGNGLQERRGKIAGVKDKCEFVCSVPTIKDGTTKAELSEANFYNKAGQLSKVYEIYGDQYDGDIFGVSDNLFTTASATNIKVGNYVVLDGAGKYVAQTTKPVAANYGFIGQIHSLATNGGYRLVRIFAIQNKDNNTN